MKHGDIDIIKKRLREGSLFFINTVIQLLGNTAFVDCDDAARASLDSRNPQWKHDYKCSSAFDFIKICQRLDHTASVSQGKIVVWLIRKVQIFDRSCVCSKTKYFFLFYEIFSCFCCKIRECFPVICTPVFVKACVEEDDIYIWVLQHILI